jgi:hypothetical protein
MRRSHSLLGVMVLLRRTLNSAHLDSWNAYKQRVLRLCRLNITHYLVVGSVMAFAGCVSKETQNSLAQHTGNAGSDIPRSRPPYYPNTAGNIVAPPAGSLPMIMNGTENQSGGWPIGRQLHPDTHIDCDKLARWHRNLRELFGRC